MKRCVIVCIFLIGLTLLSNSQQVRYLGIGEGLSSSQAFGIEKDHKGLLWFATNEGVDRYDGNEFRKYKLYPSAINPSKLGFRFNVTHDTSGTVWAYTTSGKIFRYNQLSDGFELKIDLQEEIEINKTGLWVYTLFFDKSNILWIGTTTGTYYVNISGSQNRGLYFVADHISQSFSESDMGYIFEGTQSGVRKLYPPGTESPANPDNDKLFSATKNTEISALYYDSQNKKLWIGSVNNGLSVYDFIQERLTDLSKRTPHVPIRSIIKDNNDCILVGFDGAGVRRYNCFNYRLENTWLASGDEPGGLSDNSVMDIFCDTENRFWVSTYFNAITVIDFLKPKMEFIKHHQYNDNSIRSNQVLSVLEDSDNQLWFGTSTGVSVLNRLSGRWDHLLNLSNSDEISGYKILALAEDDNRRIWIGGYGNGLHCYDKNTKKLTDFTDKAESGFISCLFHDEAGYLWIGGTEELLVKLDLRDLSKTVYDIRHASVIINKDSSQVWVGTTDGVFIAEKNSQKILPYGVFTHGLKELSNTYINCLHQDRFGNLWIGTNGGGMNLFEPAAGQISLISTENGLPSNLIKNVFSDKNDRIWVSTDKGIACVDPKTKSTVNIGFIDNFTNFPSSRNSFFLMDSGNYVLGGFSGAIHFSPEVIQPNPTRSRLILNEFKVSYQSVLPGDPDSPLTMPLDMTKAITLKHNQNSFSLSFSSINFDNTAQLAYQWKLEGFENDWTPLSINKTAGYTNIPAGKYTFKLRCYTQNSLVYDDERNIEITVRPPLWRTNVAYLIYTVIISVLFWLIYSLEQNRLQKRHASDKIKFFINTTHDIKTPLSLIKAPLRNLETDKGITSQGLYYLHLAQSNADKLARIVNQVLDFEKVDTNKATLILTNNNLASYLNEKIDSYKLLVFERDINFSSKIPDNDADAVFDMEKMDKIIDNLFSNAVKYTPQHGSIDFTVKISDREWILEISDTGIGIPKKGRKNLFKMYYRAENAVNSKISGTGIGLMLVQNLVRMHGGKIVYTSQENKGSVFSVSFPRKIGSVITGNSDVANLKTDVEPENKNLNANGEVPVSLIPEITRRQFKILIVEDDCELRNYLSCTLGKQFIVKCAGDGLIALKMIEAEKFDLIISDVMMPNLTGDELCRRIKSDINTSHIPVILLTALSDKKSTITGLEAGADVYISKPFDIDIVHARISGILKNRQLISESLLKGLYPGADKVTINNLDETFIKEILVIVERELSNPDFSIDNLCRETAMSRTLLYNKIKVHTDLAPNEFIRIIRMNKAMDLLKSGKHSIGEIAERIGFPDSKYFSTAFKKFFGKSPKHYHNMSQKNS